MPGGPDPRNQSKGNRETITIEYFFVIISQKNLTQMRGNAILTNDS